MVRRTIVGYVALTFIGYFTIGLALAILPVFVSHDLGFSAMVAGIVISAQYITTFLCRGYAGSIVDRRGPKPAVERGMAGITLSGALLFVAYLLREHPVWSLTLLAVTRLATGFGEGLIGGSPINWAILDVGEQETARAISFNGIASYGALAAGAPCGVIIMRHFGLGVVGLMIFVIGLLGLYYTRQKKGLLGVVDVERHSFFQVLGHVAPYGVCLALGGMGFGSISTFITLYYSHLGWQGAVLCLCVFSLLFITGRLIFGNVIRDYGGLRVSIACLATETLGLLVLWLATTPAVAVLGAGIAGLGFSLVFPALGVEAVQALPPSNKGSALAGYGLFIDVSLGITGPLIGAVASGFGMRYIYAFAMCMVALGFLLVVLMLRRRNAYGEAG